MIDMNQAYRTRRGSMVTIISIDDQVKGWIEGRYETHCWNLEGKYASFGADGSSESQVDLVALHEGLTEPITMGTEAKEEFPLVETFQLLGSLEFINFVCQFADNTVGPSYAFASDGQEYFTIKATGEPGEISKEFIWAIQEKAPPITERKNFRIEWRTLPDCTVSKGRQSYQYCRLAFVPVESENWFPRCMTLDEASEALKQKKFSDPYFKKRGL